MLRYVRLLLLLLVGLGTAACNGAAEPEVDLTLYVAPQQVECMGVGPQLCLLVRYDPAAEWQFFYDGIEGFTYEEGYHYTLQVRRRYVPDPPADGSSFAWRLLEVLERIPA